MAKAIATGALSLANASVLNRFINHEQKDGRPQTVEQKQELLNDVKGLSQSACAEKLCEASPSFATASKEAFKPISKEQTLLKIILDL